MTLDEILMHERDDACRFDDWADFLRFLGLDFETDEVWETKNEQLGD